MNNIIHLFHVPITVLMRHKKNVFHVLLYKGTKQSFS